MPQTRDQNIFLIWSLNYWKTPHKLVFNQMFGDKFLFELGGWWNMLVIGICFLKGHLVIDKHLVMGCSTLLL
jgi:hypothetical protein